MIALATEDLLSECIAEKLIQTYTSLTVELRLGKSGNGHLRANITKYSQIAQHVMPLLLVTDLDKIACAPQLLNNWLDPDLQFPENLLLRVAVHEIEAWLLADHENLGPYLRVTKLPPDPDAIIDAKEALLAQARGAPRDIRDDIVASHGSHAKQGLGYNSRLAEFVTNLWNPENARVRSQSLNKACQRLHELENRIKNQP